MKKLKGNDIYIQNNFIDDILENPVKFSYEQIMFIFANEIARLFRFPSSYHIAQVFHLCK